MHRLTSSVQEWFILSTVLKAFEKFAFKVAAHVITQPSDLLRVTSLWSCLFFPLSGFSCGLELHSEADSAQTLLDAGFGFV